MQGTHALWMQVATATAQHPALLVRSIFIYILLLSVLLMNFSYYFLASFFISTAPSHDCGRIRRHSVAAIRECGWADVPPAAR